MVMRLSFLFVLFLAIGTFAPCQTFFATYARAHTQTKAAGQTPLHSDAQQTFESAFSQQMPSWLVQRCAQLGFKSPTIVQETALVHIFAGKDVVLQAQTGSGKTLAYCLPVLSRVDPARSAVQTVIVVPTRELALQVSAILKQLASSSPDKILIMSLMEGSQNRRQQLWAVAEPPHIVVGNPKAIQRLITAGRLRLSAVNTVVVDEVDACLLSDETRQELHVLLSRYLSNSFKQAEEQKAVDDSSAGVVCSGPASKFVENSVFNDQAIQFRKDVFAMSSAGRSSYRNNRQTILCSATIPQRQYFAMQCYKNGWTETLPEVLHVSASELMPAQVQHEAIECEMRAKLSCIKYLLRTEAVAWAGNTSYVEQQPFQAIIFADSDESTEEIFATLCNDPSFSASSACMLTEAMGLDSRAKALDAVRSCQSKVLVCTEILARGIDVPSITHVFQFTLPSKSENYLHRAGRTGRLGRRGKVITLISKAEGFVVKRFENELGCTIIRRSLVIRRSL